MGDYINTVNPENGNITWEGNLHVTKGDHSHMPSRTEAYLPGDEKGHVTASSLGGSNTSKNIVAQHSDVNHGAFYSMEQGERSALQNQAEIYSEKAVVVDGEPGGRPQAFMVSDNVTYADGHTESIHHSFVNESYADQTAWNAESAQLPGAMEAPNPGDGLRDALPTSEYADLMESTDAELPGINADYAPADFSGLPGAEASGEGTNASSDAAAASEAGSDASADFGSDGGSVSADPD